MTERTKIREYRKFAGWVFYDGQCALCIELARRFSFVLRRRGFQAVPLQTPWVRARLGLDDEDGVEEMSVLTLAGALYGGAEAVVYLAGRIWWAWPVYAASRLPGAMGLFQWGYRWIAENRRWVGGRYSLAGGDLSLRNPGHET